jgi:hypothetical protein
VRDLRRWCCCAARTAPQRATPALGALPSYDELDQDAFAQVLTAAERRQAYARGWRTSLAGRETRHWQAFITAIAAS